VKISKLSWLLPSKSTPKDLVKTWVFSNLNLPTEYDNSLKFIEIDLVSKKLPSKFTPEDAIWKAAVLNLHSLKPYDERWEDPVQEWMKTRWKEFLKRYWIRDILADIPTELDDVHTRETSLSWPEFNISSPKDNWIVWKSWFSIVPEINSKYWVAKVEYYLNWELNDTSYSYPYIWNIKIWNNIAISSDVLVDIKVFDELYNVSQQSLDLIVWEDDKKPYTEIVRPKEW
jgi:hypothetical protein